MPRVIVKPALNKHGEALWPEKYSTEDLKQLKYQMGEEYFNAQFILKPKKGDNNANSDSKASI